ncbi:ABC transporter ATP-binding protein/permease [Candidatus Bathyarchaeota archaeon]|nr:ABC transporter ATP-binding protein/permease [Candidatus Bathyarchaeota archaeon]
MGWGGGGGLGGGMGGGHGAFGSETERRKRTVSDSALLRRIMAYGKPYKSKLIVLVVSLVVSSLCNTLMPTLHKIAIDEIIGPGALDGFLWWVPIFIGVTVIIFVTQYVQQYMTAFVGENMISNLRLDMVKQLQILSLRYFAEGETGRVMSRVTNDAEALRQFLRMGAASLVTDVVTLFGALIMMFLLNPQLSFVTLGTIPVVLVITFVLGHFSRIAYRKTRATIATVTAMTEESIAGMKVIQSFVKEDGTMKAFNEAQGQNVRANVGAVKISTSYMPIVSSLRILGTILIFLFGIALYQTGILSSTTQVGVMVAFLEYQMLIFQPLMNISNVYAQYQSAMSGVERMFDVLDTDVEVKELPPEERRELKGINDRIRFEKVSFGYDSAVPVIRNVSFTIGSNQKVAIVGPTGAGKSTLINLLCRFYDPIEGDITIDGYNLRDLSLSSLRDQIGIVLQDSFLFNKTVRENIRYGRPSATDIEIEDVAKAVGAHNFIVRLPDGYDTMISEGSTNISVGQRQLISFARALLADPQLLILDEATSSVDPYTELIIQNALQKLLENRTAIVIAHRLSTVRSSDRIIVLSNGEVVEEGTHRQLLDKAGLYSLLYRSQLRDDIKIP